MKHVFIFLSVVSYFFIFSYSSLFSYDLYDRIEGQKSWTAMQKLRCLGWKSVANSVSGYEHIIHTYLNNILDQIVRGNASILGDKDLCIQVKYSENDREGFVYVGDGLIQVNITGNFVVMSSSMDTDASIVANLSHEIAHSVLGHHEQALEMIKIIYEEFSKKSKEEQASIDFDKFYPKDPRYIQLVRQNEIAADNLGLTIYLSSGFKADIYKRSYIRGWIEHEINDSYLRKLIKDGTLTGERARMFSELLSSISEDTDLSIEKKIDITISKLRKMLEEARKKSPEDLERFISDIKYLQSDEDDHPTGLWRYLNIERQEQDKNMDMYKGRTVDTTYFRIDLTNSKRLDEIRKFFVFKKVRNAQVDYYNNDDDPRSYILRRILENPGEEKKKMLDTTIIKGTLFITSTIDYKGFAMGDFVQTPNIRPKMKVEIPVIPRQSEEDKPVATSNGTNVDDGITFTLFTETKDITTDLGRFQGNNSITFRANDLFKLALQVRFINYLKQLDPCVAMMINRQYYSMIPIPVQISAFNNGLNKGIQKLFR